MSGVEIGALCVVGAFLLFAAVRLFRGPVKLALRVLVNSALGFGAVWLLNLTAAVTGIRLGLNVFNARIPRVYYGARDREMGACGGVLNLFMEDFPHPPALVGGVLAEDCRRVLTDFFRNLR